MPLCFVELESIKSHFVAAAILQQADLKLFYDRPMKVKTQKDFLLC